MMVVRPRAGHVYPDRVTRKLVRVVRVRKRAPTVTERSPLKAAEPKSLGGVVQMWCTPARDVGLGTEFAAASCPPFLVTKMSA